MTFHKQPQSAEPDATSQGTEFHSKQIYLFWKGVCKAECGAIMLLAVNFLAQSLLACSKATSPTPPFMLGLNHQRVAAASCWYYSKKKVGGSREFLSNAMSCLHGKAHGKAACLWLALCRNVAPAMSASSQCHLSSACLCLVFSPGPTPGGVGREQTVKGICGCCASSKEQELCPRCAAEWC